MEFANGSEVEFWVKTFHEAMTFEYTCDHLAGCADFADRALEELRKRLPATLRKAGV